jgi:hypothetical protein
VRPDQVLLRVVGRALVLWDGVRPTQEWLQAQLPSVLRVRARSVAPLQLQLLLEQAHNIWLQVLPSVPSASRGVII